MSDSDKSSCYTSGEVGRRRAAYLKEEESGEVWKRRTPPTSMVGGECELRKSAASSSLHQWRYVMLDVRDNNEVY
jgi:hypothetical protein